jgi:hypothetical protein
MQAGGDPGQQLAHNVRSYLHYDNMAGTFHKQSTKARQLAGEYEKKVLDQLDNTRMSNAVIQIGGGHLNVIEERTPRCLTLKSIEMMLHSYYAKKGHSIRDETDDILKYIRANRGSESRKRLKQTKTGGALPPVPGTGPKDNTNLIQ